MKPSESQALLYTKASVSRQSVNLLKSYQQQTFHYDKQREKVYNRVPLNKRSLLLEQFGLKTTREAIGIMGGPSNSFDPNKSIDFTDKKVKSKDNTVEIDHNVYVPKPKFSRLSDMLNLTKQKSFFNNTINPPNNLTSSFSTTVITKKSTEDVKAKTRYGVQAKNASHNDKSKFETQRTMPANNVPQSIFSKPTIMKSANVKIHLSKNFDFKKLVSINEKYKLFSDKLSPNRIKAAK